MTLSFSKLAVAMSAVALMSPAPVLASWVPVTSSPDGTIMYVESGSVEMHAPDSSESGPTASFLQRNVYPTLQGKNRVRSSQMTRSVDCYTGEVVTHSLSEHDDNERTVFYTGPDKRPSFLKPGTVGGDIREFVCR